MAGPTSEALLTAHLRNEGPASQVSDLTCPILNRTI